MTLENLMVNDPTTRHAMVGFDPMWTSPEHYIIGITHQIWEDRGLDKLHDLYAPAIPVRFPGGYSAGNQPVIESTEATLAEFPDRQLLAEDVIWSDDGDDGFLSSHRILSTATHLGDGTFGPASGTKLVFRTIADCAARSNVIYDEWLVRDVGAMVRQLGHTPQAFVAEQLEHDGWPDGGAAMPLTPATSLPPVYTGRGNGHAAGHRYAEMLQAVASGDGSDIEAARPNPKHCCSSQRTRVTAMSGSRSPRPTFPTTRSWFLVSSTRPRILWNIPSLSLNA